MQNAPDSLSSERPLQNFKRQMRLLQYACLTPSGMDEELRSVNSHRQQIPLQHMTAWMSPCCCNSLIKAAVTRRSLPRAASYVAS